MKTDEFIEYIKKDGFSFNKEEKEIISSYINSVKEIESIKKELNDDTGQHYLKKFMIPQDYIRILKDLRQFRIKKFYKMVEEKKKYLNQLEVSKNNFDGILKEFEEECAQKLKLKIYRDRNNKIRIK